MERRYLLLAGKVVGLVAIAFAAVFVVHFFGGRSILPWASFFVAIILGVPSLLGSGSKLDLSIDLDNSGKSNQENHKMSSKIPDSIDWSEDPRENLKKVNSDPQWRRADDSEYDSWRKIGSTLNNISNLVQSSQYVQERHIQAGLVSMMVLGSSWFLIILIEMMSSGGLNPVGFSAIADISPFNYSMGDLPIFQIAFSIALFLLPIGYLDWKAGTTCDECGAQFSLRSKGKYWHPSLKERKTEGGDEVTIYHGVRFRECENCEILLEDTNYSWKESN